MVYTQYMRAVTRRDAGQAHTWTQHSLSHAKFSLSSHHNVFLQFRWKLEHLQKSNPRSGNSWKHWVLFMCSREWSWPTEDGRKECLTSTLRDSTALCPSPFPSSTSSYTVRRCSSSPNPHFSYSSCLPPHLFLPLHIPTSQRNSNSITTG